MNIKIKEKIIKWLGGYTTKEYVDGYNQGRTDAALVIKEKADSMYGLDADIWCQKLYAFLSNTFLVNYCTNA